MKYFSLPLLSRGLALTLQWQGHGVVQGTCSRDGRALTDLRTVRAEVKVWASAPPSDKAPSPWPFTIGPVWLSGPHTLHLLPVYCSKQTAGFAHLGTCLCSKCPTSAFPFLGSVQWGHFSHFPLTNSVVSVLKTKFMEAASPKQPLLLCALYSKLIAILFFEQLIKNNL